MNDGGYNEALARFVDKYEAARSKFQGPRQLQAQTPQFYKEAFDRYIEEYKIAKSTYDLEPGEVAWKPSPSRVPQAATSQSRTRPMLMTRIALGEEQSLFYHYQGFLPPQIHNNTGSFLYHRGCWYDKNAEIWRAPFIEGGTDTIVVCMHGICWAQKERTGFGVWFAEDSHHNTKKLEFSKEERPSRARKNEGLRKVWYDRYQNPHRIGALAATFALETTIEMMKETALVIHHIILCTKIQGFLTVLDEWKWVYGYEGWTLTRKKGRNFNDAEHCAELRTFLGKLTDLRKEQPSIRVSFRFVRGDDVDGANELAKSTKFMRERNEDGT